MKIKSKIWIIGYVIIVLGTLSIVGWQVVKVDPFFHYHKPHTELYYYPLDNQRSMNDGIVKHFDYDALITGTSMTENFRTTETDAIFGVNSIKVAFAGGSYKEINDNLERALNHNPRLTTVIRGLDMAYFFSPKDSWREDLGICPDYLYDNNVFNDVKYVFNRDVIFKRVYSMMKANDEAGFAPGIQTFDTYSYWMGGYVFGEASVCGEEAASVEPGEPVHITEEEKKMIHDNIEQNVTSLAEKYPDVTFYYFFPPYSAVWWEEKVADGTIYKQMEAEKYIIEQIIQCNNIKLFSFNNRTDITTDLNNYKDSIHYGAWVNSLMLKWMYNDQYLLTEENYADYLSQEQSFYVSYDYSLLHKQTDYENDYYAEAVLREELSGVEPVELLPELPDECKTENEGMKIVIEDIKPFKYLVFHSKMNIDQGQPGVCIYNENNEAVAVFTAENYNADGEEHQYMMNVLGLTGKVTIVFNGVYIDEAENDDSSYVFRNMTLY